MATSESRSPRRRRPRTKKKRAPNKQANPAAPIRALLQPKAAARDKSADEPLSPTEVQQMKAHFKFLRAHKKLLKLRLNAAEDLLLNGVREPTHRGVCQHLLGKVEKDRVLAVSERMAPPEAAKLLAGVLGFAPELSFVLRYLECVRGSASQPEAARAVAQALRHIPFDETSSAQMRQVLSLIVSVFPRAELPVLVFNWLFNAAFREAFDRSSEELPESLASFVRPLRAANDALVKNTRRGRDQSTGEPGPEALEGVRLLLGAARPSLLALPDATRRQLLEYGLTVTTLDKKEFQSLRALFDTATFKQSQERGQTALALAGRLLEAGEETEATRLLNEDLFEGPLEERARRWKKALGQPRVGPLALDDRGPRRRRKKNEADRDAKQELTPNRWQWGFLVPKQTRVRFRFGTVEDREEYRRRLEIWQSVLLPGVARPLAADIEGEIPYIAVRRVEHGLRRALSDSALQYRIASELCALLNGLSLSGVSLPDGEASRFGVDESGRPWLVDLWGAERVDPGEAREKNSEWARKLLPFLEASSLEGAANAAPDLLELARRSEAKERT